QVPDLFVVERRGVVRWHLGAVDPFGDSPEYVKRPPATFVNSAIQIGRAKRVAPIVGLGIPQGPELFRLVCRQTRQGRFHAGLPLAWVAAEDDLVKNFLGHETGAIAQSELTVTAGAFKLFRCTAQKKVTAAANALGRRSWPRAGRVNHAGLG